VTTPMSTDETTDRPQPGSPRRRRRWIGLAVLVAIAVLAVVLLWFQPQVLLYDTVVEDDFPAATPTREGDPDVTTGNDADDDAAVEGAAGEDVVTDTEAADGDATEDAATADADPSPSVAQPVALLTGSFDSRNRYTVTGGATVYELPDTTRILRLEGFESTNGPDLFVYLTVGDTSAPDDAALAAEYEDLGVLRGNVGDQNYTIPADIDLARFDTVVIWCRRFATAFGAADLH
jgi:hypothetical protein